MPAPRVPNRFTAGRDVTAARADMNFQALESWGAEFSAETDANLSVLGGEITALDGSLTSLSGDVSTLDAGLTALDGIVAAIDTAVGDLEDDLNFRSQAFAHVYTASAISVPDATNTLVAYSDIQPGTDDLIWWNNGIGVAHIRPRPDAAGVYDGGFWFDFSGGGFTATNRVIAQVALNGVVFMSVDRYAGSPSPSLYCPIPPVYMNGDTDRWSTVIWQSSGATRTGVARFWLRYLGSG